MRQRATINHPDRAQNLDVQFCIVQIKVSFNCTIQASQLYKQVNSWVCLISPLRDFSLSGSTSLHFSASSMPYIRSRVLHGSALGPVLIQTSVIILPKCQSGQNLLCISKIHFINMSKHMPLCKCQNWNMGLLSMILEFHQKGYFCLKVFR